MVRSFVVVVFFFYSYLQYCTSYRFIVHVQMCSKQKHKADHARAQEGTRTTGNMRSLIHGHLKAAHCGAKKTHLLLRSKHIAPKPCIAWAPVLVVSHQGPTDFLRKPGNGILYALSPPCSAGCSLGLFGLSKSPKKKSGWTVDRLGYSSLA